MQETRKVPNYLEGEGAPQKRDWWKLVKFPVYVAAGFTGAFLLYHSFSLYQVAFTKWGLAGLSSSCVAFNPIPLLGNLVNGGCKNIAGLLVGGIALVSLIGLTVLQVIPTFLMFHVSAIEDMVDQLRSNIAHYKPLSGHQSDTQEIRGLVNRHRKVHEQALRSFLILSLIAFGIEAWIIWVAHEGKAELAWVLIESCAFDLLVIGVLVFRSVFQPKLQRNSVRYQG